jgi:hypothetical protein
MRSPFRAIYGNEGANSQGAEPSGRDGVPGPGCREERVAGGWRRRKGLPLHFLAEDILG